MRALVIIPTYNEAENIIKMLHRVREALPQGEVLVVDDASPDGTGDLVDAEMKTDNSIHLIRRSGKSGLGSAYRAGFRWGIQNGYEACIEMDADFSHDPNTLPRFIELLDAGNELVIGSRYVKGGEIPNWSRHRFLLSRGGNIYASTMLGLHVADSTAGFRAYSVKLLERLDLDKVRAEGYGFQIEMTYHAKRAGARIVETPISFVDRVVGESKMSSAIVIEALGLVTWWWALRLLEAFASLLKRDSKSKFVHPEVRDAPGLHRDAPGLHRDTPGLHQEVPPSEVEPTER